MLSFTPSAALPPDTEAEGRRAVLAQVIGAEVLRHLWAEGRRDIEQLAPAPGPAHLVLRAGPVLRHVHVLCTARGARVSRQEVPAALADLPSACVVWAEVDPDTLQTGPFLWLGEAPGAPLGSALGPAPAGDETGLRVLTKMRFSPAPDIAALTLRLFGPAPAHGVN